MMHGSTKLRVGVIMLKEETEVHLEKPIAMPLHPPQLTYGMPWCRTRVLLNKGPVSNHQNYGTVCLFV